jgi:hypothetical protein
MITILYLTLAAIFIGVIYMLGSMYITEKEIESLEFANEMLTEKFDALLGSVHANLTYTGNEELLDKVMMTYYKEILK